MRTPHGPAYAALDRLLLRFAVWLRIGGAVAGGFGALLGLAPPANPLAVVIAIAALLGWSALYARLALTRGWLAPVVVADAVVVAALCLGYRWLVPAATLPGWSTWLAVAASSAVIISQMSPWPALGVLGLVLLPIGYAAGAVHAGVRNPGLAGLLAIQGIGGALVLLVLRRRARDADHAIAAQDEMRREEAVRASRRALEREHTRLLHDSVSATLTMVAAGGVSASPTLRAQAERDLGVVELIREPGTQSTQRDLRGWLDPVVAGAPAVAVQADLAAVTVPPPVAAALAGAVREALTNVTRHAGVDHVRLEASRQQHVVRVELADEGCGFDPDEVPAHRRGLRESMVARMSEVGGSAAVNSRPGSGTRVVLQWPAGEQRPDSPQSGYHDIVVSRYQRAVEIAVLCIIGAQVAANGLVPMIARPGAYRWLPLEAASWIGMVLVGAIAATRMMRRRTSTWWLLAVGVLAMGALATAALAPHQELTRANWALTAAGWFGLLVLLRRPVREIAAVIVLNGAFTLLALVRDGAASRGSIAQLLMIGYAIGVLQLGVAQLFRTLENAGPQAARTAEDQAAVRRRGQVAQALHHARLDRYRTVRESVVPLLLGLASGRLNPTDRGTQRRCAVEAARLRRLFAETDDVPDPLLHELRACADIASSRGVLVDLQVVGRLPELTVSVRRALTEAPLHALAGAEHQARVTVLGRSDEVAVSVLADAPLPDLPPDLDPSVTVTAQHGPDWLWIETRWTLSPAPALATRTG